MWHAVTALRVLILVPVAYACACCVAALIPTPVLQPIISLGGSILVLDTSVLAAWVIGMLALVPMLALVVLAEVFQWRAWYVWVPAGAAIGLLFFLPGSGAYADFLGSLGIVPTNLSTLIPATAHFGEVLALAVVGGLIGGWVYWSIAGRYSGVRRNTVR